MNPMIKLSKGAFLRLRHTTGKTVTEQDEPRDVMLRPGQQFTLSRPGLAVLGAPSDASISVDS
jgi:hypothetical protein